MTNFAQDPSQWTLGQIQAVVKDELRVFHQSFKDSVREKSGLLSTVLRYVLRQKGKRIRPTLVLLSAKVCGGVTEASYRAATLVELLHTATLMHDDVVDESERRRGAYSVNALWGNKVAVLVGDYFLSKGLLLALEHDDVAMLRTLSDAVRRMAKGELLQAKKSRRLDLDEDTYFRIISDKTASLISACTLCGAISATAEESAQQRMRTVGEELGLAFQIRDDLFDYGSGGVGKPVGLDLQKKLVTLPLIHALGQVDAAQRKHIIRIVRRKGTRRKDRQTVIAFAEEYGGLAYATERMTACVRSAQAALAEFPESEARSAMIALAEYCITRKR